MTYWSSGAAEATRTETAGLVAPARPSELLPRRGHRARVAGEDRHVEPADVDAELERVRRDDAEDLAVAQAALDRPPLGRQVAAAIAADAGPRPEPLAERLAQPGQQDLDGGPGATEDDRLAARSQERQRPAVRERVGRATGAGRRVDDRRIDEQDVALAGRGAGPVDQPRRPPGEHLGELSRVRDRRGAADDDRRAAVVGAQSQQPPDHVRDVAAVDARGTCAARR